jgi:ABC-type transport system involved in multi-copper enzyme maturation permease subunit
MKALALVLAVVFFIVAILYWTGALQFATSHPGPHPTHAILFAALALLSLVWMRFQGSGSSGAAR